MRYLNKFNESNGEVDIKGFFIDTIDLCDIDIEEVYFDTDNGDYSFFRGNLGEFGRSLPDVRVARGYKIEFNCNINPSDISGLSKYLEFVNNLHSDCDRFIKIYKPTYYKIGSSINDIYLLFYKKDV